MKEQTTRTPPKLRVLSAFLAVAMLLNLAAPLALADSVKCTVAGVELTGDVDSVPTETKIAGQVSYLNNTLTFHGDVTLTTVGVADLGTIPLIKAISEKNLRLVANGKVTGKAKGNGIEGAEEIDGGEYDLTYADWGAYSDTKPKGILGRDAGTTITAGTKITLKDFHTGIGGGSVQIKGTVNITGATFEGATYGIANSTTMNPGSELEIHADRYIMKDCLLTYNGGHLLMNVAENGDGNNIVQGRLSIGNVSRFWYRTDENGAYTEITVNENFENFTVAIGQNQDYLELTDVDPNQQQSENYDLWVAGTRVTKTNQDDVLGNGTVKFDPDTHTLTLRDANFTLDENAEEGIYCCIQSKLTDMLTITGKATLSNANGIVTTGPLTLENADLTLTGDDEEDGEEAIRAGSSDEDITIQNSKVTIEGTNSEGNFFHFGIRCGKLTVANSTLDVKTNSGSAIWADEMEVSGAGTVITAETDLPDEDDYALALDDENPLTLRDGLALVAGKVNESKTAKIALPEQNPDPNPNPDPDPNPNPNPNPDPKPDPDDKDVFLQFEDCSVDVEKPDGTTLHFDALTGVIQSQRLPKGAKVTITLDEKAIPEGMKFSCWVFDDPRPEDLMEDGTTATFTMQEDIGVLAKFSTLEEDDSSADFGTIAAATAVVGVVGATAYLVGTEAALNQLLPAGTSVPQDRAQLALLLWNTAGRPEPAALPAFADVTDPDTAKAAQWCMEAGFFQPREDGNFKPGKHVSRWKVLRTYQRIVK